MLHRPRRLHSGAGACISFGRFILHVGKLQNAEQMTMPLSWGPNVSFLLELTPSGNGLLMVCAYPGFIDSADVMWNNAQWFLVLLVLVPSTVD